MAYTQKNNTGTLFRNEKKSKPTDKDYGGSAMIEGVEYWINGWIQESRNPKPGEKPKKFLKCTFIAKPSDMQPPSGQAPSPRVAPPVVDEPVEEQDNLPF